MLKERQKSILDAAIRGYINTARPVASEDLVHKFRLDFSSATVRNEMSILDELGYLVQPHTSAGRIPTDQGYRFFVDHLMETEFVSAHEEEAIENLFLIRDGAEFTKEASKTFARLTNTIVATGLFEKSLFYESGLSEILDEPEFHDFEEIKSLGRIIDRLEDEVRALFDKFKIKNEEIFIGNENPLRGMRSYTMIVSRWHHPRGFSGFLTMIGPKRMNYSRCRALLGEFYEHSR